MILVKILFPTCITLNKLVVFRPKPRPSTRDDNLMWVDAGDSRSPPGTRQGSLSRPAGYAQLRESHQHPRPDPRSWRQVLMVLLSLDSSEEVRILIKVRGCHNGICCHDWGPTGFLCLHEELLHQGKGHKKTIYVALLYFNTIHLCRNFPTSEPTILVSS